MAKCRNSGNGLEVAWYWFKLQNALFLKQIFLKQNNITSLPTLNRFHISIGISDLFCHTQQMIHHLAIVMACNV